ncbi:MAG: nucleotidyltransferase domain-containing protein, partial [Chloroflexia bacterium]
RVPPINARERIPQAAIDDLVEQIASQFNPQKIILFGSYAYGTPGPDSDVDLLVVMETPLREAQQAICILQAVEYHFGLDLLVETPENLAERLKLGDFFLREVAQKGMVMYEHTNG